MFCASRLNSGIPCQMFCSSSYCIVQLVFPLSSRFFYKKKTYEVHYENLWRDDGVGKSRHAHSTQRPCERRRRREPHPGGVGVEVGRGNIQPRGDGGKWAKALLRMTLILPFAFLIGSSKPGRYRQVTLGERTDKIRASEREDRCRRCWIRSRFPVEVSRFQTCSYIRARQEYA